MNIEDFKEELNKSYKQIFKIGLILFLLCGGISAAIIAFSDEFDRTTIVGLCIFGLFVVIGALMVVSATITKGKIARGEHELLLAIRNNENLIVWIYQHTMTTQHELSSKKHKNHSLQAYKSDGKPFRFMVKSEERLHEMITFLSAQFPSALVGFSEENRKEASQIVGKEIKVGNF